MKTKQVIRPTTSGVFPKVDSGFYELCLGNGTAYRTMVVRDDESGSVFIGIEGKGCCIFGSAPHANYVKEKIHLTYANDACNLADFIAWQFTDGVLFPNLIQGSYATECCSK